MIILKNNEFGEPLLSWFSSYILWIVNNMKRYLAFGPKSTMIHLESLVEIISLRYLSLYSFNYNLYGTLIANISNTIIDFGIKFDQELNFNGHIEKSCCKALKTLGFIKRISKDFNLTALLKALYCALVRSILEYAEFVLDPYTSSSINQSDRAQRKFLNLTTWILKINHLPYDYEPVLNKLNLSSL